jgi:hypothetical protein
VAAIPSLLSSSGRPVNADQPEVGAARCYSLAGILLRFVTMRAYGTYRAWVSWNNSESTLNGLSSKYAHLT